jgi:glutamyl-tRNA reductase
MFTTYMLLSTAKSVRETAWLLQYQNVYKHLSKGYRSYISKKTDLKIHTELNTNRRQYSNFAIGSETVLPKQAQVVICGAGTVANSVAYHLVQNGWNDILVLEQKK